MDHLYQAEDKNGARLSWNLWPSSRIEYKKLIAPLACMYTPLKRTDHLLQMYYPPLPCSQCSAILNPFCQLEQGCKFWSCPFCTQRNAFPPNYHGISETTLPAEILSPSTTIEYCQNPSAPSFPVFLFLVDTTMNHLQELKHLKESLLRTIEVIPKDCYIGLITFGATVRVYDLAYPYISKCVCFDGEKDCTSQQVQKFLGVGIPNSNGTANPSPVNSYILPLKDVETRFASLLDELITDPQSYNPKELRAARATGVALSIALSLLRWTFPNSAARVLLLTGGPTTIGPGLIVSRDLKEDMRSHHHIKQDSAKHVTASMNFFQSLASRAVSNGHAVDIFSCSLDQVGILEMRSLVRSTGGTIVSCESFTSSSFRDSLFNLFNTRLENGLMDMAFNGNIHVVLSPEVKVCGVIGHVTSGETKSNHVSEVVTGIGGTSSWKMSVLDSTTTYAFYFDIVNSHNTPIPENRYGMIQFKTSYVLPSGVRVLRVTTLAHNWSPPSRGIQSLVPLFDQEATVAIIARLAAFKSEDESDPRGWLDKHLIQICNTFGKFKRDQPDSFELPNEFQLYPEFIFHFRRGHLCQVFGNSPDESTFFRHHLMRESVSNILTMIQPSLDAYGLDREEPAPVLLSSLSIKADQLLLLDTYFHVVVFSGDTIAKWREAGYHKQSGYENFAQLLEAPLHDAKEILAKRFPVPMYVTCDSGSSQARFLYAVLDPAETHMTTNQSGVGQGGRLGVGVVGEIMYTEDVPLSVFLHHLYKKAVSYTP
eukprot:TRINITY_DN3340_c0_g1_i1.p1 TRINITY_DN3340_c0_g1~~TRINITY_DN3340_c0_g1_i1.p1  ORF type:complete len:765 (+),score=134.88 TRINITY_DN3340_c0_g1_i1:95-2389(+)